MGLSPKRRFAILQRDEFTCQYCGRQPPEVVLHVDHMKPLSKSENNKDENLVTACKDCNLGKGTQEATPPKFVKQLRLFFTPRAYMPAIKPA